MSFEGSAAHELVALQRAQVLVIGDVMLDCYIQGEVHRMSPEAPVPVVLEDSIRLVLGGAANVAANIASIGATASLIGRIGADRNGDETISLLDAHRIRHDLITTPAVPTTAKSRIVAAGQQLARIDSEVFHETTADEEAVVRAAVQAFLESRGPRALVLADYAKGFLTTTLLREVIQRAVEANVPVVSDPKGHDLSRYAGSTVIKPNLAEARFACDAIGERASSRLDEIAALADQCGTLSGARNVVLSCSADGIALVGTDVPEFTHLPANTRDVADVSGAGDTLVALTALGLAAAMPLRRSVEIANLAAGAVCGKSGTATLSGTELLTLIGREPGPGGDERSPKILVGQQEAGEVGAQYHSEGRRLVFANGCFDLLHAGHIKLLKEARSLGDALMVALNSDDSVRRLKGEGRPIQSADDRCEILAALSCVDFVVIFDEDTPLELITAVRPMVVVKGDDYTVESVVGASEIEAWGGSVVLITRLDGRSTTGLIESRG